MSVKKKRLDETTVKLKKVAILVISIIYLFIICLPVSERHFRQMFQTKDG